MLTGRITMQAPPAPRTTSADALIRRLLDIGVAGVALVCLSPLMVLIAIALCVDSGLPIFFAQARLGRGGCPFTLFKFRKFGPTEGSNGLGVTLANDPRLTRVGAFLERTKLDELPQLWNVVKGDMSLVGPRPETPNFGDCFGQRELALLDYRPGVFGPSQVIFRNESALYRNGDDPEQFYRDVLFPTKARVDLAYYPSRTVLRDIAWVFGGILAVCGLSRRLGKGFEFCQDSGRASELPQKTTLTSTT